MEEPHVRYQSRDEKELQQLKNRLHRLSGQLAGIEKMLDENRYCGEILIQIAAVQSGLHKIGEKILHTHMKTCMVHEIEQGNLQVIEEVCELMEKLK